MLDERFTITLADGTPFTLTTAWWHNAAVTRRRPVGDGWREETAWFKHLSHGGRGWYERVTYGTQQPRPPGFGGRCADPRVETHDGHGHQVAVICCRQSRLLVIDVDDPVAYAGSETARLVGRGHAMATRGEGFHAYVAVPGALLDRWPRQGVIPGGDVKSNGFVPMPGCLHYSGEAYEPVPGAEVLVATGELLEALRRDRATRDRGTVSGAGDSGDRGEGNEPTLFSHAGALLAAGWEKEEAWARWLELARTLTLSDPAWPWTEADRDVFERQWDYCERQHAAGRQAVPAAGGAGRLGQEGDRAAGGQAASGGGGGGLPPGPPDAPWDEEGGGDGGADGGDGGGRGDTGNVVVDQLCPWPGYVIPDDYEVTADGVFHERWVGRGEDRHVEREPVAVRPFLVSRRLRDDHGETRFELTWLTDEGAVQRITVEAADTADRGRLGRVFPDHVVTSETATRAVGYVSALLTANRAWLVARGEAVATALGWPVTGTDSFTSGPGRPRPVEDVRNTGRWLAGHVTFGSSAPWHDAAFAAADRPLVQVTIAASLAAPLLRRLGAPSFVVDVSGPSSSGKTISLGLAAAAWGDPARVLVSWQDTRVAIEHHLSMLRGMPLFLNESQLANPVAVEDVVYGLTEGQGKGRSRQDGSGLQDVVAWEAIVLSTGEQPLTALTQKGGVVPRVVTACGSPCADRTQAERLARAAAEGHGHAGPAFLDALARVSDATLRQRYDAWRHWLVTEIEATRGMASDAALAVAGRRADSVAVLALANALAAEAAVTPLVARDAWRWLAEGGGADGEDEEDRSRAALRDALAWAVSNAGRFDGHPHSTPGFTPTGGWLGAWRRREFVAFVPQILKAQLRAWGYDVGRVLTDWRDRGWIRSRPKTRTYPVTWSDGSRSQTTFVVMLDDLGPEEPVVDPRGAFLAGLREAK